MLVASPADGSFAARHPIAPTPVPLLLYRRGPVPLRALAALESDRRVEIFAPAELTAEWVAFSKRAAACIVATSEEPFGAFASAVMSGLRERVVMAIDRVHAHLCDDLLKAGAHACVTMPLGEADVDLLVASIAPPACGALVDTALRITLDPVGRTVRHGDKCARLTQREFALLHCLVSREGRAARAEELLATAWGDNPSAQGSRPVLEVYVHQLRKKLAHVGLAGSLRTVRGFGYELSAPVHA